MNKVIKNISAFFLLLAGLAIILHSIIPHDHHQAESGIIQNDSCPLTGNNADNHGVNPSGSPVHCHAFNDLVSAKLRPYHISQNIQFNFFAVSSFSDTSAFELQVSCVSIICLQKPVFDSFALELSLLRAPPALA